MNSVWIATVTVKFVSWNTCKKKKKVKLKSQTQIIPIQTDTRSSGGPSQGLKGALAPQIFEKN